MSDLKIHFSFEPDKQDIAAFAESFIRDIGQTDFSEADTIVTIGGDGSLLHAFRRAQNTQKLFGMVLPNSNSQGFWTNHGIESSSMLLDSLGASESYRINPIKAKLVKKDGTSQEILAFNEIMPFKDSGQAMLVELRVRGSQNTIGPIRLMGDGLILATPFGSTAINRTYGGPSIDIRNSGLVLTGVGIYEPDRGFSPVVASDNTCFELSFLSQQKRPVHIEYDGQIIKAATINPFEHAIIQKDRTRNFELLLVDDPSTRAFSNFL